MEPDFCFVHFFVRFDVFQVLWKAKPGVFCSFPGPITGSLSFLRFCAFLIPCPACSRCPYAGPLSSFFLHLKLLPATKKHPAWKTFRVLLRMRSACVFYGHIYSVLCFLSWCCRKRAGLVPAVLEPPFIDSRVQALLISCRYS